MVGGVAAGLAKRTGVDVTVVRVLLVLGALVTVGMPLYVLAWLVVPMESERGGIVRRLPADRRGLLLLPVAWATGGVALALGLTGQLIWPVVAGAAGLTLVWRNASADERLLLRDLVGPLPAPATGGGRWRRLLRALVIVASMTCVVVLFAHKDATQGPLAGPMLLIWAHGRHGSTLDAPTLVLVAIVVALAPWWMRVVRDLVRERQARVRAEERADMAAWVHDSVLQTLALIQRRADEPQQVVRLARAQERELRSWLFDGRVPGTTDDREVTVGGAVRTIQQEVEAGYGTPVEIVSVGDCEVDDDLRALLAAAREATVNAAKWSGAAVVSLFAEVEPAQVSVFVRDRGSGFDPAAVPADRRGLAESVHARMARRGGSAVVHSGPGEGTEVILTMPRAGVPREVGRS